MAINSAKQRRALQLGLTHTSYQLFGDLLSVGRRRWLAFDKSLHECGKFRLALIPKRIGSSEPAAFNLPSSLNQRSLAPLNP